MGLGIAASTDAGEPGDLLSPHSAATRCFSCQLLRTCSMTDRHRGYNQELTVYFPVPRGVHSMRCGGGEGSTKSGKHHEKKGHIAKYFVL